MEIPPLYIEAPARLHLGFLDLDGEFGRRFGGIKSVDIEKQSSTDDANIEILVTTQAINTSQRQKGQGNRNRPFRGQVLARVGSYAEKKFSKIFSSELCVSSNFRHMEF